MRKAISFIGVVLALVLIAGQASAKLMRPAKQYDTTVSGHITVDQTDGKKVYYLTDPENNRTYTLGNRNGELGEEFVGFLEAAVANNAPVTVTGELSVWKDRVLSLEIEEVEYAEQ